MIPATAERVTRNTAEAINRRIQAEIRESVRRHAVEPERIGPRLRQLDEEWDVERTLEANAASLALAGIVLGVTVERRWLALPAAVAAFLLQHAVQGWCPPLPVLRRLGFRTAREIGTERVALKAVRGDFAAVEGTGDRARAAYAASRS